ncbi:MAG: hypothetical protein LBJ46_07950 [Planctomycetota bacterium]|jgi:hypothetical protein|nr:hypothetical protein [Planctomycetota bacterium]
MADDFPGVPETISAASVLIKALENKTVVTRADREAINKAKLRIAFWACSVEKLPASRENLTYVLGPDAKEIMDSYDRYLIQDKPASSAPKRAKRPRGQGSEFWG